MKLKYTILAALCLLIGMHTNAQFQGQVYTFDTSVKVFAFGQEKTLAWCGGFNNPQFAMADLNNDGKQDLIVFEWNVGLRTFINTGVAGNPNYVYHPEYELNFPPINGYLILADYNCDGIPDLFHSGSQQRGFDVWKGYYNSANQLCFTHYKQLYYNAGLPGNVNAYVNPGDIPAIVDIDGDGDLDFLSHDGLSGNFILLYKNMQVENHLPCDSIIISLTDSKWGRFYFPLGSGNAMCLLDYNGDGNYDLIDGSVRSNSLLYLQNGKGIYSSIDSMVYSDTSWQSGGHQVNLAQWPAAFNIDIDQDGKKDLLVSPHTWGENSKNILFYKNTGTTTKPNYVYQNDSFLVDKSIDVGTGAYPMFFDYDKDGKPDLFIGSDGYYQSSTGTYVARIAYYKNTSTPGNPSFTLVTDDFMGLSIYNFQGIAPAVGDINNDGNIDLVIGHRDGSISSFINYAKDSTTQPVWKIKSINMLDAAGDTIMVDGNAAPFFYDINQDGKPDMVVGSYKGVLNYYQNENTVVGQQKFALLSSKMGCVEVDSFSLHYYSSTCSVPFIGKMDNTGKDYLLLGGGAGYINRYDGFTGSDINNVFTLLDSCYSYIDSTYSILEYPNGYGGGYGNLRSAPAVADIDGDGKYEMVVGYSYGGVKLFKQTKNVPLSTANIRAINNNVTVAPNPARDILNISWDKAFIEGEVCVTLYDEAGKTVLTKKIANGPISTSLKTGMLSAGMYYCTVCSGNNKSTIPVSIIK